MVSSSTVDALFTSVGALIPGADVSSAGDGLRWHIRLSDGSSLFAQLDPARAALSISSPLGAPPHDRQETLAVFLLQLNFAWIETSGLRLAMDSAPETPQVHLLWEVPLTGLGAHEAHAALTNFADKARTLRKMVARGGPEDPLAVASADMDPEDPDETIIRV
jgi:hypothetical protein